MRLIERERERQEEERREREMWNYSIYKPGGRRKTKEVMIEQWERRKCGAGEGKPSRSCLEGKLHC